MLTTCTLETTGPLKEGVWKVMIGIAGAPEAPRFVVVLGAWNQACQGDGVIDCVGLINSGPPSTRGLIVPLPQKRQRRWKR